ncbi:phospho-sugar mutase [Mycetocola saprophilus]|uniref:phospho-sugar mutase n=1 Tax=Mycetocola saprophilus TaxID=76636 RepID=UPI003BEFC4CE
MSGENTGSVPVCTDLLERAEAWLAQDPDPETRDELSAILEAVRGGDSAARADLADRFAGRLEFGTAGLRGRVEAGSNRMNRVLVSQAAAGIGAFLNARAGDTTPSVVIGYDGRKNSDVFARDSAELLSGVGIRVTLLPRPLPTPVLAFAVRQLGTSAGIMVTASHNPPADNGYKVYLGDEDAGSQIVAPVDAEIATQILRIATDESVLDLPRSLEYAIADEAVIDAYVRATAALVDQTPQPLRVVYTAMHGVGWETFAQVVTAAGLPEPIAVAAQRDPDAAFPTVAFPNPEEPGALDLAIETAREHGADLIIANDPDADRCSVAIPDPAAPGGFRQLTGNQIGWLLGWRAAERARATGRHGALACTIVSSPALAEVARQYQLDFAETLTGFKWVSRVPHLLFGYEEAIGYLVNPDTVHDKDGISAGLAVLELAGAAAEEGRTLGDMLDEFATRFGYFGSDQLSIRFTNLAQIPALMARLRETPPALLGSREIVKIEDLSVATAERPGTNALRWELSDGARIMIRPSGTEPKVKFYLDVRGEDETILESLVEIRSDLTELVSE